MIGSPDYIGNTDPSVVIRSTAGIAVYTNENDDVVIRQDGGWQEDDIYIVVSVRDAALLAEAILAEAGAE